MSDILSSVTTRQTEQTVRAKPEQVPNAAGGYVYQASDDVRLHRFLTLGTDGSTYYTSAKDLTRENAEVVFRAIAADPLKVVAKIVEISTAGRAPRQNPAIFALAICAAHASDEGRAAALAAVPQVCRTGSTLFTFVKYAEQFRGWGRGMRKAVGRWYDNREVDKLAYQLVKYRAREDWRHFDTLRLAADRGGRAGGNKYDMTPFDADHAALYNWQCAQYAKANPKSPRFNHPPAMDRNGVLMESTLPRLVYAFEELQSAGTIGAVVNLIAEDIGISWEMIPDRWINEPRVWEALLAHNVPQTALLRQLPRITRLGLGSGSTGSLVALQLQDPERLKKARVHPINVLVAMRTYASGKSEKGSSTWTPDRKITDALDAAFYAAFGTVERTGKSTMLALDVSGSMEWQNCSGMPITPREAAAALSMVTANVEPEYEVVAFTAGGWQHAGPARNTHYGHGYRSGITKLDISPRRRLDDIIAHTRNQQAGGTDCALPMIWAAETRTAIDSFFIYTDGETWAGTMHVDQALDHYRQTMGRDARVAVVAMTAQGTSLCNPEDPGMLDVSGFDSTVPNLLADFSGRQL